MATVAETEAQRIAARFHEDGTCWTDDEGERLEDVLRDAGATEKRRGEDSMPLQRFVLPDGSAILITSEWWDVETQGRPWACESTDGAELGMQAEWEWREDTRDYRTSVRTPRGQVEVCVYWEEQNGEGDPPAWCYVVNGDNAGPLSESLGADDAEDAMAAALREVV